MELIAMILSTLTQVQINPIPTVKPFPHSQNKNKKFNLDDSNSKWDRAASSNLVLPRSKPGKI